MFAHGSRPEEERRTARARSLESERERARKRGSTLESSKREKHSTLQQLENPHIAGRGPSAAARVIENLHEKQKAIPARVGVCERTRRSAKENKEKIAVRGSSQQPFRARQQGLCETQMKIRTVRWITFWGCAKQRGRRDEFDDGLLLPSHTRTKPSSILNLFVEDASARSTEQEADTLICILELQKKSYRNIEP